MNILVVAAHGLYDDYGVSFVHSQAKEYIRAGHHVRAIVPVAIGKRVTDAGNISAPVTRRVQDGVEIYYLRYPSLGHGGENGFNPSSAQFTVRLFMGALLRGFAPDIIHAHAILNAFFFKSFKLRIVAQSRNIIAGNVVNSFLVGFGARDIFVKRREFFIIRR